MPELIVAALAVAVLVFLVVRAARSEDPDRWVVLLAQVFFLALVVWGVASILLRFRVFPGGFVGAGLGAFYDLGRIASIVAKASFVAMAFLLMFRAYRRLRA